MRTGWNSTPTMPGVLGAELLFLFFLSRPGAASAKAWAVSQGVCAVWGRIEAHSWNVLVDSAGFF